MIEQAFAKAKPTVYDLSDRAAVMRFVWVDVIRLCEARHRTWAASGGPYHVIYTIPQGASA